MKLNALVVVLFIFSATVLMSDRYDSIVAKARKAKGKSVIVCSPEGEAEGSVDPGAALRQLKRGMTLKFLPGNYPAQMEIQPNNVIIEGEIGKKCGVDLKITGKKCIVRNLYSYMDIESEKDIIIIDSVINRVSISAEDGRDRLSSIIYNSAMSSMDIRNIFPRGKNEVYLKYCAIIGYDGTDIRIIYMYGDVSAAFDKCVLYSPSSLFYVNNYNLSSKKSKLALKNSIFYGSVSLGKTEKSTSRVKTWNSNTETFIARDIKDFKKICRVSLSGSKMEKPIFKGKPKQLSIKKQNHKYSHLYCLLPPDSFTLTENSPGKDMEAGVNSVNKEGFPAPPGSNADKKENGKKK